MSFKLGITSILYVILNVILTVYCDSHPEITIAQGTLRGKYVETFKKRKVVSFEGIPYAKAPVGHLRFQNPVPADPWSGTLDATKEPPACIQYMGPFNLSPEKILGTEDCLFINVYTPKLPSSKKPNKGYDVIGYIHGGAYTVGKALDHGPFIFLDKDIILVTFNYRLGPLGFLSTGDSAAPGNFGLKDQSLALKWIQENIHAFGGNPKSVTVAGMSAGGSSCSFHLLSPLSKGLFKGAMCMSGVPLNPWSFAENSKEKAEAVAVDLGCPTDDPYLMVDCLRGKQAHEIVNKYENFAYGGTVPFAPFAPVVEPESEGAFIFDEPLNILKKKKGSDVPVIFAYTLAEGAFFGFNPNMFDSLRTDWDNSVAHILDYNFTLPTGQEVDINKKIKHFYKIDKEPDNALNYVKLLSDRFFEAGISKFVKVTGAHYDSPVYLYRFSYTGKKSLKNMLMMSGLSNKEMENHPYPSHGDDVIYTLGYSTLLTALDDEQDAKVTREMQDLWVTFAAKGKLGKNWEPVQKKLPKIVFTDILGPNNLKLNVVEEIGEESFWDSLGLNENFQSDIVHTEL